MDSNYKQCKTCGRKLHLELFPKNRSQRDGHLRTCKDCHNTKRRSDYLKDPKLRATCLAAATRWREEHRDRYRQWQKQYSAKKRDRVRISWMMKRYGCSPTQYAEMLKSQDGRCACCGSDNPGGNGRWVIDHDHLTKQIRGLLCHRCNLGLGYFEDDLVGILKAADYLYAAQKRNDEALYAEVGT